MAAGGGFTPHSLGIAASEIGVWIFSQISPSDPELVQGRLRGATAQRNLFLLCSSPRSTWGLEIIKILKAAVNTGIHYNP